MHILLNGLAASAGGGLTYLRNVVPHLATRQDVRTIVLVRDGVALQLQDAGRVSIVRVPASGWVGPARLWHEQRIVRRYLATTRADVLVSAGNMALFWSPVPQVLLSRNALYTSAAFSRDLISRREYGLWLDTRIKGWLAGASVRQATITVAPSQAFATDLRAWTHASEGQVTALPHGFDGQAFFGHDVNLPPDVDKALQASRGSVRLLSVTHYNYFRNIDTLIRALPLIRQRLGRNVTLMLTCNLNPGPEWGAYDPSRTKELVKKLGVADSVLELGLVPYGALHKLYAACDAYVTAAYAESFAHPLVEAMASGRPVIASALDVHREVCDDAALYFPHSSAEELTDRVAQIVTTPHLGRTLGERGRSRSSLYSWSGHVDRLVALAGEALGGTASSRVTSMVGPAGLSR